MSATPGGMRDVDLLATGVALVIAIAAVWVGIWPMFERQDDRHRLALELALSRGRLADVQNEYGQVRGAIAATSARLLASSVVLHTADVLVERQEQITATVTGLGLSLEQLTVGSVQHGDLIDTIPIRLAGQGGYPAVVAMMHELRTEFPDMAVITFQLLSSTEVETHPDGRTENRSVVRFELNVAWYTARPDAS